MYTLSARRTSIALLIMIKIVRHRSPNTSCYYPSCFHLNPFIKIENENKIYRQNINDNSKSDIDKSPLYGDLD